MVMISHDILLDELLNGSKITTWRLRTGDPNQRWAQMKLKLDAGERIVATHYWKARTPKSRKSVHYIGESILTEIVPRTKDSITKHDATLDGFKGTEYMKLLIVSEMGHYTPKQDYWQIFFTPKWVRS